MTTTEGSLSRINEELGTTGIVWDLGDLYSGPEDRQLSADKDVCKKRAAIFADRYRGRVGTLTAPELLDAVKELEAISELMARMASLAHLDFSVKVTDSRAGAFLQSVREFGSIISRDLVFFDIEWANVPEERADFLLAEPVLAPYRHYLKTLRRYRPHLLSEVEERLLVEISPVRTSSWVGLFEKVMAARRYGTEGKTQEEVLSCLYSPDRNIRMTAAKDLTAGLREDLPVLTHIINTILADKMIDDRLRSYAGWLSSMNLANELDDETVACLIASVTRGYGIVERYYRLKKDLLGVEKLQDFDRYAPLPHFPSETVHWDACRKTVLEAFARFSPEMAGIARRFFDENWMHVPVLPGKAPGAFAHPCVPAVHPYILVNYTGNFRDVETVAHELGHGVHQFLASRMGFFNSQTPLTIAETASVFAELLVFKDLMARLRTREERLAFLCSKIESIFATVFRQIAMNRFEDAIHTRRRESGELSSEDFSALWLTTQQEMFGDSLELTPDYGVWWAYIGHFVHAPGYVYAYAFGELLVLSLYRLYEKGYPDFTRLYLELLASGGGLTPYELLSPFGVDLRSSDFWDRGLDVIDGMVADAERLATQSP